MENMKRKKQVEKTNDKFESLRNQKGKTIRGVKEGRMKVGNRGD